MTQAGDAAKGFARLADNADRRIEEISEKLVDDAEKFPRLLSSLNRVATKVEAGEGTAAQLLNDPKLYQNLLGASEQLAKLTKELREFLAEGRKSGIPLKLK